MTTRLHRREYKFLIDERTADRIRSLIDGYCEVDENAVATGGRYLCDTLYFDSHHYAIYKATIANAARRYKVRVRGYPMAPSAPVFLEVKRRIDETIVKTRARLTGDWAAQLDSGTLDHLGDRDRLAFENFLSHYLAAPCGLLVPKVLVRYEREPFAGRVDHYARVTFDRDIRFQQHAELSMESRAPWTQIDDSTSMWPELGSMVVLELKFLAEAPPRWMRLMVERLELRRVAYCKYTRAIDSMLRRPTARRSKLASL